MTASDWLDVFSRIGAGVRRAVLPLSGTEAGRAPLNIGAGGDRTIELDARAEEMVFAELANLGERGERFSVLSEEAGLRRFGDMVGQLGLVMEVELLEALENVIEAAQP